MLDAVEGEQRERAIRPARKLAGQVAGVFVAPGQHFETVAVEALPVTFAGVEGDLHAGITRLAGSREPWHKRGTEMRNERQLSIVAPDELARVAAAMSLAEVRAEWLGANLLLDGVADLSMLPAGTLLLFAGGAAIKVDAQNKPCRDAGRLVALRAGMADPLSGEMLFPKVAKRLRGLVGWVERPGTIRPGEGFSARVPEQWIY